MSLLMATGAFAATKEIKVGVKGMVCSFCAQGIEKKFKGEEAVSKIDVKLEQHLVTLSIRDGKSIAYAQIQKLLQDAGYTVDTIERVEETVSK